MEKIKEEQDFLAQVCPIDPQELEDCQACQ
jgi:hypothetical protein